VIAVEPSDRVLLLDSVTVDEIRQLAQHLEDGLLVALVPEEQVPSIRHDLRDYENVMITPAGENGIIPWRDEFFTIVQANELSQEVMRVLAQGGSAWCSSGRVTKP
jgi:hypothetical protein